MAPRSGPGPKKFVKRGDLEQMKVQQEQAERKAKEDKKRAAEDSLGHRLLPKPATDEPATPLVELPTEEVIRRLRKLRKPIT